MGHPNQIFYHKTLTFCDSDIFTLLKSAYNSGFLKYPIRPTKKMFSRSRRAIFRIFDTKDDFRYKLVKKYKKVFSKLFLDIFPMH